jgi:hypothetical protein
MDIDLKNQIIAKTKPYNGSPDLLDADRWSREEYHMTQLNYERLLCNTDCIEHIIKNSIEGDVVEIGVWRGGSMLAMLLTLEELNTTDRKIHLYDTFDGMTEPTEYDVIGGESALDFTKRHYKTDDISVMCKVTLDEVKNNIETNSNYPKELISYHKGDIVKTNYFPEKIALLRLDTDWYESTKFEMDNFYDRVSIGGVIIIDDYNAWDGSKKAVDEFLLERNISVNIIDATGGAVFFIKP